MNHPVRKKGKHFKGKADHQTKPLNQTGDDVLEMVKDIKVVFGKRRGSIPIPKDAKGHAPMWKKKSIFWELPYWNVLEVHNAIDVVTPKFKDKFEYNKPHVRPRNSRTHKSTYLKEYYHKFITTFITTTNIKVCDKRK